MRIAGMLRVRNEARWIERVVASIRPLCQRIYALDDHSDDGTFELLDMMPDVAVYPSHFEGLDEVRDKNFLLRMVTKSQWDWVVHIDGDEVLADANTLGSAMANARHPALSLQVLYCWGDEQTMRTDGVYANIWRPSAFQPHGNEQFHSATPHGFHCGNVPITPSLRAVKCEAKLLHLGYMEQADRLRKYQFYRERDPDNAREDNYRHIVQGDVPEVPADARLKHAGPLTLAPLS